MRRSRPNKTRTHSHSHRGDECFRICFRFFFDSPASTVNVDGRELKSLHLLDYCCCLRWSNKRICDGVGCVFMPHTRLLATMTTSLKLFFCEFGCCCAALLLLLLLLPCDVPVVVVVAHCMAGINSIPVNSLAIRTPAEMYIFFQRIYTAIRQQFRLGHFVLVAMMVIYPI